MRGMSLVDVIIGSALALILFLAFFGLIRTSLVLATTAKAKAGANAVLSTHMEYIRSLSYDSVGTVGGIPPGVVDDDFVRTFNNVEYRVRTLIAYVDDAKDGSGAGDGNGITTDYKQARVSVAYYMRGEERTVFSVSTIAPPGIESTTGGGTLSVRVVDAVGAPVSGATIRIVNASTSPAVNFSTFSNIQGMAQFPGAATSSEYQVFINKNDFSSTQTYPRTILNANPNPGFMTVTQNQTTSATFAIDRLATFTIRTRAPAGTASSSDSFSDSSKIVSSSGVQLSSGALILSGSPGSYVSFGNAFSTSTTPAFISAWSELSGTMVTPAQTSVRVFVRDGSGTLIPDTFLPGNSIGFTAFPISLSSISTSTYPTLSLSVELSSANANETPALLEWILTYETSEQPVANVPFTVSGNKTIGSTAGGSPIFKTIIATTTDASGERVIPIEWDIYSVSVGLPFSLIQSVPESPYQILPGTSTTTTLFVSP